MPGASERTAVVFGARHLGRGIAARLSGSGWRVVAAARTETTIDSLASEQPDVIGRAVDLGAPGAAAEVLEQARRVWVPSTWSSTRSRIAQVSASALSREREEGAHLESAIGAAVTPVHNVVDATVQLLRAQGHGCFIQITGGLALRALAGTGPLAATGYVTRALIEGAVPEAREDGVHVALLVIRGHDREPPHGGPLSRASRSDASMTDGRCDRRRSTSSSRRERPSGWTHVARAHPARGPWQG